jgi:hypothetical protein
MKTRMILASLAVFFTGFGVCRAGDLQLGTWNLNEAKSKLNPEAARLTTAVYAPAGDSVKITVDGEDYPVTGDPRSDMRSYRMIDDRTLELTVKKAGNVVTGGSS